MARHATLVAAALALLLLLAPQGLAWYKPAAGPSHYSVGRAAGLLSGFRGSPFARRSELAVGTGLQRRAGASSELRPSLRSLSCQRLPDGGGGGTFQCKADVFLSLRAADCHRT
uniref:Neuropeptide B n=1 Tax=Urocitellus parryii TaxID=9999 RepID=A0A8D2GQ83_UROPR